MVWCGGLKLTWLSGSKFQLLGITLRKKKNKGRGGRYQLASKPRGTLDFVPDKEASTEEEISVAYRTSDVCTGKMEVYTLTLRLKIACCEGGEEEEEARVK